VSGLSEDERRMQDVDADLMPPAYDAREGGWRTTVDLPSVIAKMSCLWLVGRNRQRMAQLYPEDLDIGDWVVVARTTDDLGLTEGTIARVCGKHFNESTVYIETADELIASEADEDYQGGRWIHTRYLDRERYTTWEAIADYSRRALDTGEADAVRSVVETYVNGYRRPGALKTA